MTGSKRLRLLPTGEALLGLYELGIEGCGTADAAHVNEVLETLIAWIGIEDEEIAQGFRRLYTFCLGQTADGQFGNVSFILANLRDTLVKAMAESASPLVRAPEAGEP